MSNPYYSQGLAPTVNSNGYGMPLSPKDLAPQVIFPFVSNSGVTLATPPSMMDGSGVGNGAGSQGGIGQMLANPEMLKHLQSLGKLFGWNNAKNGGFNIGGKVGGMLGNGSGNGQFNVTIPNNAGNGQFNMSMPTGGSNVLSGLFG